MRNENSNDQNSHQHKPWLGDFFDKIVAEENAAINSDFPLSGGEEHPHVHYTHDRDENVTTEEQKHKSRLHFLDHLDTEFPLSGGEA